MTPKQKIKSIEKKMDRLQNAMPFFDFKASSRNFTEVTKYYELDRQHFLLKFEIEHCNNCGKKL